MRIYSEFSHLKWWFSTAMLVITRGYCGSNPASAGEYWMKACKQWDHHGVQRKKPFGKWCTGSQPSGSHFLCCRAARSSENRNREPVNWHDKQTTPNGGVGKCPNWTSPKYWGYNLQQILESDVQNPKNGTFTKPCLSYLECDVLNGEPWELSDRQVYPQFIVWYTRI